jgi:hypothetical protein
MNASQRRVAAITLAVIGALCVIKAFSGVYVPEQDLLIVRVTSHYDWSQVRMGWLIGGVLVLGAAAAVARGGREP